MARSKRMSVNKRLREKKKAEAAALKRELRNERGGPEEPGDGGRLAEHDDLVGFGVIAAHDSPGNA